MFGVFVNPQRINCTCRFYEAAARLCCQIVHANQFRGLQEVMPLAEEWAAVHVSEHRQGEKSGSMSLFFVGGLGHWWT
jgi:hypothetical protein